MTAGNYSIIVQDSNGCHTNSYVVIGGYEGWQLCFYVVAVYFITLFLVLKAETNVTNVSCFGFDNGEVTITATGGTGSYEYSVRTDFPFFLSFQFIIYHNRLTDLTTSVLPHCYN